MGAGAEAKASAAAMAGPAGPPRVISSDAGAASASVKPASANALLGERGYGSNSDFQHNMSRLLDQVNDAARSIRLLADFLDRHPEALVRGRTAEAGEK